MRLFNPFRRKWNLFGKVLLKLTTLNTSVLLLVLIFYNVLLYMVISDQLYKNVDNDMRKFITHVAKAARRPAMDLAIGPPDSARFPLPPPDDPRIMILFINTQGELINPNPNSSLNSRDMLQLIGETVADVPQNVIYNGRYYRYIKNSYAKDKLPLLDIRRRLSRITDTLVIANVEPEVRLLHTLMIVITAGTLLVFLIIVGVGYFLANKALTPINKSWEKQEQFVADASHEMRTPLAVIKSHAEMLLHYPDSTIEKESAHIASIINETARMSKLVAKLLVLARSDSNQLEIELKPICINELVANVVTQFQPIAELKKINLSIKADHLVELIGDKERIAQLLVILLDNAIKYTAAGGTVAIMVNKKYRAVELAVNDTGIGISTDDLPHIFDRFYRADKSRSAKERGTGLGLAIAKWIVEKHSGNIRADSSIGVGTTMVVTFPLKRYFFL